jgi:uncharacterized coiled-coil protein SlyX
MDPVLALAIVSFGAFLIVLITAIIYVFSVRSYLLESSDLSGPSSDNLRDDLAEQRASIERLGAALTHHTEQLAATASTHPTSEDAYSGLHGVLSAQSDTVDTLLRLVSDQGNRLEGIDERLARQTTRLDHLVSALERGSGVAVQDDESLNALIRAQSNQLMGISTRLDQWSAASSRSDEKLAEQARILAELDRELAAQAQVVQKLDGKVNEHTTMLVAAAAERREQSGRLDRILQQLGQMIPLVNRVIPTPQPHHHGEDRLTDIKGIGPVYASKLYEAGVESFRQLATMTPDEILILLNLPEWRRRGVNPQNWIEQAQTLASQREKVESVP